MLLAQLLKRMIKKGTLTVIDADGDCHVFEGTETGRTCTIRLHDRALHHKLFFRPELHVGEAYMNGTLTVEAGDIYEFAALCGENMGWGDPDHWAPRLRRSIERAGRRIAQFNPAHRARRNVAHHYDLSGKLYELFLDADRQYSCAYYLSPNDELETAQEQKKRHIAAKLLLEPKQKVLDIGSGWGGLALSLAKTTEVDVTGITLSTEQHQVANERARKEGMAERVRFGLQDYRQVEGRFDRIVSVGMFEHVGVSHYDTYFRTLRNLLAEDGVALLHTIGRAEGPNSTNPWIARYIFPGGYSPALSEVTRAIERAGLYITDIEVLRLHYAETLRAWRRRFRQNRDQIRELYDERFCRMWEMYLAGSEVAFRYCGHVNFQIQLARRQDAVPLSRDYISDFERAGPKAEWRAA
ncbi:MAG: cyclopropane-fatty-acyl-phospholipid synthase family protein [Alphaproteobacteria bacterium]|nr:cyclopropane-fatty-acyl-phospholipid synthase family protein [Alphaproteobacteria bacterium]